MTSDGFAPGGEEADESIGHALSGGTDEEAAEVAREALPHMTEAERAAWLARWRKGGKS